MNIDIRENVINNIKLEDIKNIVGIIDEATLTDDEIVLPGLGVMLSLFWNKLDKDEKIKMATFIKENIK